MTKKFISFEHKGKLVRSCGKCPKDILSQSILSETFNCKHIQNQIEKINLLESLTCIAEVEQDSFSGEVDIFKIFAKTKEKVKY